jgi:DhnA family fructose-bisphosphate aldolase class Ia
MNAGLMLRKQALFNKQDGRSVVIAMDHAAIAGPIEGIIDPKAIVQACVAQKVDGILTNKGFVDASVDAWDRSTALVLRLTGGFTVLAGRFEEELIVEPETALAYGAACAAITVKFGHEYEGKFIKQASLAIDRCHALGLPVMLEAMAKGTMRGEKFASNDAQAITMVARMGSEIGADLVKTYYTGSPESFAKVVEGCPVPIVILGGAKTDSIRSEETFGNMGMWKRCYRQPMVWSTDAGVLKRPVILSESCS